MMTRTVKNNGYGTSILFCMLILTAICYGRIITVDDNAPADFNNIQAAINAFAEGDSIVVANGNYIGKGNRDIINSTDSNVKNLIIRSTNGPEKCIINVQGRRGGSKRTTPSAFLFQETNKYTSIVIDGFTITEGGGYDYKSSAGGGIYINDNLTDVEVINCIFKNNEGCYGGAIYLRNGNLKVKNCSFIDNLAACGGGISCESEYQINSQSLIVENSNFNGNWSMKEGGAIFIVGFNKPVFRNCVFNENISRGNGGIYVDSNQPVFENCIFSGNTADSGGGIYCISNKPIFVNCAFTENYSGGVYILGKGSSSSEDFNKPIFNSCSFSKNNGTGVYIGYSSPIFNDCNFIENDGLSGRFHCAGVLLENGYSSEFNNCEFVKNKGSGVIFLRYFTMANFKNCLFAQNSATENDGGGICSLHIGNINLKINDCKFIENSAHIRGGGISGLGSNSVVNNCTFTGNSANEGGGIWSLDRNSIVNNCAFVNNSAKWFGGGISGLGGNPIVNNCTFVRNSAYRGGGICGAWENPKVNNCTFVGNSANENGGGIWTGENIILKNSIFWNNTNLGDTNVLTAQIYQYIPHSPIPNFKYIKYNCIQGWTSDIGGVGNINLDPSFVDPCNPDPNMRDYHLLVDSPCINTGDPNYVAEVNETDLDGNPRVIYGRVDMGAYEFLNKIPVANAGIDQIVYAYINNMADVNLDGSGSNDGDGDTLTYKWTWTIDGNTYEANGVKPEIELPVGMHTIELVVNDGIEDSLPDYVDVNVVGPVKGSVKINPQAINLASQGNLIKANIVLPEGFTVEDVDTNVPLVVEPMGVRSKNSAWASFFAKKLKATKDRKAHPTNCIEALFDRGELCNGLDNGEQKLSVVGQFKTGQYFYGSDIVKVIGKKR